MAVSKRHIRAFLYLQGATAKRSFHLLQQEAGALERELGSALEWREGAQDCVVAAYLRDVDPANEDDWPRQHDWLATRLNDLHRVFADRVRDLDPDEWRPDRQPGRDNSQADADALDGNRASRL